MCAKSFLSISLLISTQLIAMQFDQDIENGLKNGVNFVVNLGNEKLKNPDGNGAFKIYKQLQQDVADKRVKDLLLEEGYKPVQNFCTEVLSAIFSESTYSTYLDTAVSATERDQQLPAREWQEFRQHIAHVLTDILEQKTNIRFNRDPRKLDEFLEMNKELKIESQDGIHLKAAVLMLYHIQQIQKNEVDKVLKLENK